MALEPAFKELSAHCTRLRDTLFEFRTTVVEDKPLKGDVVLVDEFGDAADELAGWLEEALGAIAQAQQAVSHPTDLDRARRGLAACQTCLNRVSNRFYGDLVSYERISELLEVGGERGGEWSAWARGVKEALYRCRPHLYDVSETVFLCWQEVTERIVTASVSVHATNIGQQISVPEASVKASEGFP